MVAAGLLVVVRRTNAGKGRRGRWDSKGEESGIVKEGKVG
jgi:hypothetical protein